MPAEKPGARELDCRPSFAARGLVRGSTGIVGVLLPSRDLPAFRCNSRMISDVLQASDATPHHFLHLGQGHPRRCRRCLAGGYHDGVSSGLEAVGGRRERWRRA